MQGFFAVQQVVFGICTYPNSYMALELAQKYTVSNASYLNVNEPLHFL